MFVVPLLLLLQGGSTGRAKYRARLETGPITQRDFARFGTRVGQALADVDSLAASSLGPRERVVVVWAGMRGAVTVAAAQTIPTAAPQRELLVLVAFDVAATSLLLQGGTLSARIRFLNPSGDDPEVRKAEQEQVLQLILDTAARTMGCDERVTRIQRSRDALLDARDEDAFSVDVLGGALARPRRGGDRDGRQTGCAGLTQGAGSVHSGDAEVHFLRWRYV